MFISTQSTGRHHQAPPHTPTPRGTRRTYSQTKARPADPLDQAIAELATPVPWCNPEHQSSQAWSRNPSAQERVLRTALSERLLDAFPVSARQSVVHDTTWLTVSMVSVSFQSVDNPVFSHSITASTSVFCRIANDVYHPAHGDIRYVPTQQDIRVQCN
jgi:hypothetical protein